MRGGDQQHQFSFGRWRHRQSDGGWQQRREEKDEKWMWGVASRP
jgi:hypothetical protein